VPFDRAAVVHHRDLEFCLGCLQVENSERGLAGNHLDRLKGFAQDQNLATSGVDAIQMNEVLALGNAPKGPAAFDVPGLKAPFALTQPVQFFLYAVGFQSPASLVLREMRTRNLLLGIGIPLHTHHDGTAEREQRPPTPQTPAAPARTGRRSGVDHHQARGSADECAAGSVHLLLGNINRIRSTFTRGPPAQPAGCGT